MSLDAGLQSFVYACAVRSPSRAEMVAWPLYDTVQVEKDQDLVTFFSQPVGTELRPGIIKGPDSCNVFFPNCLPDTQAFWCSGLSLVVLRGSEKKICDSAVFELHVANKIYLGCPADGVVRRQRVHWFNPAHVVCPLDPGLGLASGIRFCPRLKFHKPVRALLRMELHGFLVRPVS